MSRPACCGEVSSAFVVLNAFPYGSGHLLVVPYRHVASPEELRDEEYLDFSLTLRDTVGALKATYGPDGMNVGMNMGSAAGAGIPRTFTPTRSRDGTATPTS
jgi:ATP adenylyltransferase